MKLLSQQDYVKAGIEFKNALQKQEGPRRSMAGPPRDRNAQSATFEATVPILRTIVELDPKDVEAKLKLGHLLLAGNALDQALDLANAAIELDGRNRERVWRCGQPCFCGSKTPPARNVTPRRRWRSIPPMLKP